jgi:hypothetical protein
MPIVLSGPHVCRPAARRCLLAHRDISARRAICLWLLCAFGGVTAACRARDSAQRAPTPVASVIATARARKVFFEEFVAKRTGHKRESRQLFELPPRAQPPFALLLDYAVDEPGAVIVELNGKQVTRAPSFPASGHYDDSRRIEIPLTLSRSAANDISTSIATVGWGFVKVQVVGYWTESN